MNNRPSITDFLALRRNTVLLMMALVLVGTGERLWLGFAPKYLETLGAGVLIIGLFDALQTLLGAVYAYPGGWLTDHWGERRSLLLFNALSLAGYILVLVWQHWLALVVGAFLFLAWSALSLPATFTVVASSLDKRQHTMGIGAAAFSLGLRRERQRGELEHREAAWPDARPQGERHCRGHDLDRSLPGEVVGQGEPI